MNNNRLLSLIIYPHTQCTIDHGKQTITYGEGSTETEERERYTKYAILQLLYLSDEDELYKSFQSNLLSELTEKGKEIFEAYKNAFTKT